MSIDHGKLLALASEIQSAVGQAIEPDVQHVPVTWLLDWAERLRALAQPAEAVEGERRFLRAMEDADAREIGETDAAQGAVAIGCDWPNEGRFTVQDEPDEHAPCWLVMPGGAMLALNHHATNGVDQARAAFIANACNAALDGQQTSVSVPTCKVCLRSIENCGEPLCPGKFRATHPQAAAAPDAVSCNDPMCDQVLRERDQAEEIINKLCDTVLGTERAEWSSSYFFEDAVEDVKDELHRLRKQAAPAQGDGMVPVAYYYRRGKEERGPYMLPNTGGAWLVAAGYKEILLYEKV